MKRRALLAGLATPALPQDGPVTIIAPFTPGTGPDILARLAAPVLQAALGQPVVVDNRPGASGAIGSQAVARAAPDGRTLLMQVNTFVMGLCMLARVTNVRWRSSRRSLTYTNCDTVLAANSGVPAGLPPEFVAITDGCQEVAGYALKDVRL